MMPLVSLQEFLRLLHQIPYLASKHAYRVTHHFLEMDEQRVQQFCQALLTMKTQLTHCEECWAWQEKSSRCVFCNDTSRDKKTICVVEQWFDVWAIERSGSYNGLYHVLGGAICPLEGRGADDLTIDLLIKRSQQDYQEIIFALNQTPEGDATAAYIARKLENFSGKLTCLARGVPMGSTLEYLDRLTMHKAVTDRRPF